MRRILVVLLIVFVAACAPVPTPTATVAPPTATDLPITPFPTDTPGVTPTDEPGDPIEPFPDAPACPSHDDREAHGSWDAARGCHYDHPHMMAGVEPQDSALHDIYREHLSEFGISYEWQTPNENHMKHAGYFVLLWPEHIPHGCAQAVGLDDPLGVGENCVTDFYVQFHGSTAFGMGTRHHSQAACFALDDDGVMCTGGWVDYLKTELPYKSLDQGGDLVILAPEMPVLHDLAYHELQTPYLASRPPGYCTDAPRPMERDLAQGVLTHDWNQGVSGNQFIDQPNIYGARMEVDFQGQDAWGGNCPDDPTHVVFPQEVGFECAHCDNSENRIYRIDVNVPDLNGDGSRVQFTGFTNLLGNISTTCTEASNICAPIFIDAMPGNYLYQVPIIERYTDNAEQAAEILLYDMDEFFDGETSGWITFPGMP
jgi:hypothetical protein